MLLNMKMLSNAKKDFLFASSWIFPSWLERLLLFLLDQNHIPTLNPVMTAGNPASFFANCHPQQRPITMAVWQCPQVLHHGPLLARLLHEVNSLESANWDLAAWLLPLNKSHPSSPSDVSACSASVETSITQTTKVRWGRWSSDAECWREAGSAPAFLLRGRPRKHNRVACVMRVGTHSFTLATRDTHRTRQALHHAAMRSVDSRGTAGC